MHREWEELLEGEVQENLLDDPAGAEFLEEEEEGWEEHEEFVGEDPPDDPEELPPVFSAVKPANPVHDLAVSEWSYHDGHWAGTTTPSSAGWSSRMRCGKRSRLTNGC